jgi:proteasome accessory factor B
VVEPKVRAAEPAFGPLLAAVQAGRVVRFAHRRDPSADPVLRTVEPWGVVSWGGRWYLVGHDRDRDDVRCFRLSRIAGPVSAVGPSGAVSVPADVDLMGLVRRSAGPPPVIGVARVWVADGRALGLRRLARPIGRTRHGERDGDVLELDLRNADTLARWVAGHGPDVAVLEPAELAEAVRTRWRAAGAAHAEPTTTAQAEPTTTAQAESTTTAAHAELAEAAAAGGTGR